MITSISGTYGTSHPDDVVVQKDELHGPVVTLGEIRSLFVSGLNTKGILRARPDIHAESIAMARAFIIATDPVYYNTMIGRPDEEPYKILIDECLSKASIMPGLQSIFGHCAHTQFVGLNGMGASGTGDGDLWKWAVNNNYDAIVTGDLADKDEENDLTGIVMSNAKSVLAKMDEVDRDRPIDLQELPILIRFKQAANQNIFRRKRRDHSKRFPKAVIELIGCHRQEIQSYLDTRTTPCIDVTASGVVVSKTYAELYDEVRGIFPIPEFERKTRKENMIEHAMNKILATKRNGHLTVEQLEHTKAMVRASIAITLEGHSDPEAARERAAVNRARIFSRSSELLQPS